jgi:hypothetical protein
MEAYIIHSGRSLQSIKVCPALLFSLKADSTGYFTTKGEMSTCAWGQMSL